MLDLTEFRGLDEEMIVDSSEGKRQYLLISPKGGHIKLAPGAYRLVKGVHAGHTFEALAREFSEKGGQSVSPSEIEAVYRKVAEHLGSIINREGDVALPSSFWFRFRLIPASIVARVSSVLAVVFHPAIAISLLGCITASFAAMLAKSSPLNFEGSAVWLGYLLFILSLMFHEFGHASACARYGAKPSDIGFTFYLIYPAFYSDVTEAWQLKRWQRVIVDLGGTYFQFVVAGVFIAAYFATGWEPLRVACLLIWYGTLFSLNPIFKFDGYWIVADALGVTNLSKQPSIFAKYFIEKIRRRNPPALPWPGWLIVVLSIYAPLTFIVWAYFLWRIIPFLISQTLGFPHAIESVWETFSAEGWSAVLTQQSLMLLAVAFLLTFFWHRLWALFRNLFIARARAWLQMKRMRRHGTVPFSSSGIFKLNEVNHDESAK